jgi:hypothetical protein
VLSYRSNERGLQFDGSCAAKRRAVRKDGRSAAALAPVLAIALTAVPAFGAQPPPARVTSYQLTGTRDDGVADRIVVRPGRWDETLTRAPGVTERLTVERGRVVRYGIFGDVNVGDPSVVAVYGLKAGVLTGTLPPPSASETMRGPRGTPVTYEHYHHPHARTLEITREHGAVSEASLDPWFALSGFRRDAGGVVTGWRDQAGHGFHGVRSAAPALAPEPPLPDLQDGDPTDAELDGTPVKVFLDTGWTGLSVSPELAAHGTPTGVRAAAFGVGGPESTEVVRFATFTQLGVTRAGQIANVASVLPEGYDAVEGIGMFPARALHFARDGGVRVDRRGCRSGARMSTWYGVAIAITEVSGALLPFSGWGLFDTGMLSGFPIQFGYPRLVDEAAKRKQLERETYAGVGGSAEARCTIRPAKFTIEGLGSISHRVCYIGGEVGPTGLTFSTVAFNPVELLGGPVTIDTKNQLICRDR